MIAAILQRGVAAQPAKANQAHSAFHPQSSLFQAFTAFSKRVAGSDGVVDQNHGFVKINFAFNHPRCTVILGFLAHQQAAIASAGLQNAGLQNGDADQSISSELAAIKMFEQLEEAASGKLRAARAQRNS